MALDLHRTITSAGTGATEAPRTITSWLARRRVRRQLRGPTIVGRVDAIDGSVLSAPLTGRHCVAWVIEVRRVDVVIPPGAFVSGGRWSMFAGGCFAREDAGLPFCVDGSVVVDPRGAELAVVFDHVSWSINPSCPSWPMADGGEDPAQRSVRERFGITDGGWLSPPQGLEYREAIITPGQPVTVVGIETGASPEPLPSTPFRDAGAPRREIAALVISTDQNA